MQECKPLPTSQVYVDFFPLCSPGGSTIFGGALPYLCMQTRLFLDVVTYMTDVYMATMELSGAKLSDPSPVGAHLGGTWGPGLRGLRCMAVNAM